MPARRQTGSGKLSDLARHVILPSGIVSTGWPAVRDRAAAAGIVYDEWQDGLGRAMLAKRDTGLYASGIGGVLMSIPRQVGKTFTVGTMMVMLCIIVPNMKVLWTAHRARTSDETFKSLQGFVTRKNIAAHVLNVRLGNGQQEIEFHNGSRILFGARESGFGRGFEDVDVVVFDEAQILTERALDDMVPSTNVAPNPLILMMGTPPKPTDPSEVFTNRRAEALAGDADDMMYVEFSADRDANVEDRAQWRKANPSYPHRTSESSILRMKRQLGDASYRREGMGIWDEDSFGGVFPPSVWSAARAPLEDNARITSRPVVALDAQTGLSQSFAIAASGGTEFGYDLVAIAHYENGAGEQWTREYIVDETIKILTERGLDTVAMDGYGENAFLRPIFAERDIKVTLLKVADMRDASVGISNGFINSQVRHLGQEPLNKSIKGAAKRKSGNGFVWSQENSSADIVALRAATAAWWVYTATADPNYEVLDSFY